MRSLLYISLTTLASLAFLLAVYFEYCTIAALNSDGTLLPSVAARYALASSLAFVLLTCVTLRMKYRDEEEDDSSEPGKFFDAKGLFIVAVATSFLVILVTISTGAYDKRFFGTPTDADLKALIEKHLAKEGRKEADIKIASWNFEAAKKEWVIHIDYTAASEKRRADIFLDEKRDQIKEIIISQLSGDPESI